MIFSRGRRSTGRHARQGRPDKARSQPAEADPRPSLAEELGVQPDAGDQPVTGADNSTPSALPKPALPTGPYDITEAPDAPRLDLGSMQIPSVTGVQVRVQANQDGTVSRVVLVHGASALQLAAFAAPRSEPLWNEVCEDIRRQLFAEGVAVQDGTGEYGAELHARVRTQEGLKDLRFVGIDGPRWLVRADYQGPAALDPASSPELIACLQGLVVDRGDEARPAKEALPLRLSAKMAAQVQQQTAAKAAAVPGGLPGAGPATGGPAADASNGGPAADASNGGPAADASNGGQSRRKPSPRPRPHGSDGTSGGAAGRA